LASRSASLSFRDVALRATIIGGMLFGLSRKAATEFSFFLAVPTLVAAGALRSIQAPRIVFDADLPMFGVGLRVASSRRSS
jgi:undecaprenyl-diphosphatase